MSNQSSSTFVKGYDLIHSRLLIGCATNHLAGYLSGGIIILSDATVGFVPSCCDRSSNRSISSISDLKIMKTSDAVLQLVDLFARCFGLSTDVRNIRAGRIDVLFNNRQKMFALCVVLITVEQLRNSIHYNTEPFRIQMRNGFAHRRYCLRNTIQTITKVCRHRLGELGTHRVSQSKTIRSTKRCLNFFQLLCCFL